MKDIPRTLPSMLIAGALAGFLSGLIAPAIFGLRGALFGCTLSLSAWLLNRHGWKFFVFVPGLVLGIGLGFFPQTAAFGELSPGNDAHTYDVLTLINCALVIPLYSKANLPGKFLSRFWRMLIVGLLSALVRTLAFEFQWEALPMSLFSFVIGSVPFILLWLAAISLTEPRDISGNTLAANKETAA